MKDKSERCFDICPFDGLPCPHPDSCDEVLADSFGTETEHSCTRAVRKVRRVKE